MPVPACLASPWHIAPLTCQVATLQVEIAARCMRLTDEHGNLDEGWLLAAELIIRAGMRQFASHPNVARLSMLYANFLYSVRRAHQVAGHQLVATKKMQNLDMDLRFQYFCRERQRAQSVGSPEAMDLVSSLNVPSGSSRGS